MKPIKGRLFVRVKALLPVCAAIGVAVAAPEAKIEVFDPYETWLEGERWGVYVRVTNTGSEPFPLLTHPDTRQLFLEATLGEPSRPLPQNILEDSLPKVEEAQWSVVEQAAAWRGAVDVGPGEQFVYGPEAFIDIEGLHALQSRRMSSYRVHLLLADGVWFSSREHERRFVINNEAWKAEPIAEIPLSEELTAPAREISVDGDHWLFEGNMRLCRVPIGKTPKFVVNLATPNNTLTITFEDTDRVIRVDNDMGFPISGPSEFVPQLALWQALTNRPMGWATSETRAETVADLQMRVNNTDSNRSGDSESTEDESPPTESVDAIIWPWIAAGVCLLFGALWMVRKRPS